MISSHIDYEQCIEISLDLNTDCNFKCPYCYAHKLYSEDVQMDYDKSLKILDALKGVKYPIHLNILGGEPTLYNRLNDFIQCADKLNEITNICIFSNGSHSIENIVQTDKVSFLFTYHPYDVKNDVSFVKNIMKAKRKELEIMITDKSLKFAKHFPFLNPCAIFPVRNFKNPKFDERGKSLSPKDVLYNNEVFSQYEMFEKKLNRFKGWLCEINLFRIDVYGNIFVFCIDDNKQSRDNIFINKDYFRNLELKPIICQHETCENPCYLYFKKYGTNI